MPFQHRNDFIGIFAQHPVAANLLMVIMILSGVWGLANLNVQFFPNFEVEVVNVRTVWSGRSRSRWSRRCGRRTDSRRCRRRRARVLA